LELELIDFGAEEVFEDEEGGVMIYGPFNSYGSLQKVLEEKEGVEIVSSGFERIPQVTKELTEEQMADVEKLLEKLEEDEDVQNVYHNMVEN
jgi:transcriptional/translational regulatory protein YebC/TACO1